MDISLLEQGNIIFEKSLNLSKEEIAQYLDAVGDHSSVYLEEAKIPPLAILAQAMSEAMTEITLPPGSIHTSQEIELEGSVSLGTVVGCICTISSNVVRNGARFLILEFQGVVDNCLLFKAKTTLVVTEVL